MREHYDFSKGKKNPYAAKLRKPVTIRVPESVIQHFKDMSEETGLPYQNLINLYLAECVDKNRRLKLNWTS